MPQNHELELFVMDGCPFYTKVTAFLAQKGIEITQRNISTNEEAEAALIATGGKRQVPCLFIDGTALYESDDIIAWVREHLA